MSEGIPKEVKEAIERHDGNALHAMGRAGGCVTAQRMQEAAAIRRASIEMTRGGIFQDAIDAIQEEIAGGQREAMEEAAIHAEAAIIADEMMRLSLKGVRGERRQNRPRSLMAKVKKPD